MPAHGFSAKVQDEAFRRCEGLCEECGGVLKPGRFEFDHRKARAVGGDSSLANCRVLCVVCHLRKTLMDDMPGVREAAKQKKIVRKLPLAAGQPALLRRGFQSATEEDPMDTS